MRIDVIPKKCGTKAVSSGRHGERRRVRHRTVDTLKEEIETLESESTEMRKKNGQPSQEGGIVTGKGKVPSMRSSAAEYLTF